MRAMQLTLLLQSAALTTLVGAQQNASDVIAPCDSTIFCQGPLLRDVQLAMPFMDSKTFVDMPTLRPVEQVLAAYGNLSKPITNDTALQQFLTSNFGAAGTEIGQVNGTLSTDPVFLQNVNSSIVRDFTRQVIDIWPTLTRAANNGSLCAGCDSSFIPLNRTFVVAGGRFREIYYWDSFFILEGLLRTQGNYTSIAKNTIENFLDFIELYGFVPNGGRKYYLNRSQPPLLSDMIQIYLDNTNDTSILERAVPLLIREQAFFEAESINQTMNGTNYTLYRYAVKNNQPRPESYLEDYETANNATFYSANGTTYSAGNLSTEVQAQLYANLASGAESGWDYSSRWLRDPLVAVRGDGFPLRSLNTENIVPVDLQAIQYSNALHLSTFYAILGNRTEAARWSNVSASRLQSLTTFNYNATLNAYFDYNLTSSSQDIYLAQSNSTGNASSTNSSSPQQFFSPVQFYPYALKATSNATLQNASLVYDAYAPVREQLDTYPGGISATNLNTGQQWDAPNVWPPLQYFLIKGLLNSVAATNTSRNGSLTAASQTNYDLALTLAQRYVDSAYCTWRSTGGSHPTLNITRLPGTQGNGTMFEKYSNAAIDAVGGGGEYEVVPGFGWSNGVLIWAVDTFAAQLQTPDCSASANATGNGTALAGVGLHQKAPVVKMVEVEGRLKISRRAQ